MQRFLAAEALTSVDGTVRSLPIPWLKNSWTFENVFRMNCRPMKQCKKSYKGIRIKFFNKNFV